MLNIPDLVGWHETGTVDTLRHFHDNQYENGYASIQAITNQFMMIQPYAIDAKGNTVVQANIINNLAAPNKTMSGLKFREALAIMSLVHNKVYVRVWHTGNTITESNITGFTFLEGVQEIPNGNGITYQTPQGESLTDQEVIVLMNINPYNLARGYSVASAVRRWANIDDYIAAYESGFFENGAVPSGQFIISAPSTDDYQDIVRNLKTKHRGSGKNNNVVYDYAPTDPLTGKPLASAITWVPFNVNNDNLALGDIFTQVNQKIDSAYGVPASMRGVNDNNTYASVRVDQEIFIDNTIRPFTTKLWTQFTHELNNITGGLGYFITFDLETPHIAEEDLAKAQTETANVGNLIALVNAGSSVEDAVAALCLPDTYLLLSIDKSAPVAPTTPTEDVPEVDEGDEVEDAPDDTSKSIEALSVNCKQCGRYLFKATGTTVVEDMPCPKCKATNNFKIINPLGNDVTHKFTYIEAEPKDWKMVANSKQLSEAQIALITDKIEKVVRTQMEDQITSVNVKSKAVGDQEDAKIDLYAKQIISIVEPVIQSEGAKQYLLARTIQGMETEDLTNFTLDQKQIDKYTTYLQDILKGYSEDTASAIRKSLETDITNNLPVQDIQSNLQSIMNTDEYRVKRIAQTEANRAGSAGSIYAMQKVQDDTGLKIAKIWQARPNACQYCQALNGTEVGIEEVFVNKGDDIDGVDGGVYNNSFGHMEESIAHPNCGCYTTYKVIKD